MNTLSIWHRTLISLNLFLTVLYPFFHPQNLQATSSEISFSNQIESYSDSLANGFTYTILPSPKMQDASFVKLIVQAPSNDLNDLALSILMQQAFFYGTEKFKRDDIVILLNQMGLDIHADSYVQANELNQTIQFSLAESHMLDAVLPLIQQLTLAPQLTDNHVELARQHILNGLQDQEQLKLKIASVTASEVRAFHAKWYRPDLMHLFIVGHEKNDKIVEALSQTFGQSTSKSNPDASVRLAQLEHKNLMNDMGLLAFLPSEERIDWQPNEKTYIVDGKIWMNEPNWINRQSSGKAMGIALIILGIGLVVVTGPAAPAIIGAGLSAIAGAYLLTSDYLKDPQYVEQKRQEDLQQGFEYAYRHNRAAITLTPYERRSLFLNEMVNSTTKNSILLLADLYDIMNPLISSLFFPEEMHYLSRTKREFIQQRNQYKMLVEMLDQELNQLTAPIAQLRDIALNNAHQLHEQNYYVATKRLLKETLDQALENIELAYKNHEINIKERDEAIQQAKAKYEEIINTVEFQQGLELASAGLAQLEAEIQANYAAQVEQCKLMIRYEERLVLYRSGQEVLIKEYDYQLRTALSQFPLYVSSLPDFVDLRAL